MDILILVGDRAVGLCRSFGLQVSWVVSIVLILNVHVGNTQDWPQILGPGRDGVANGEKLLDQFPNGVPRTLWTHPVGQGYAGPVIGGDQVIIFHRTENQQQVESLDAETGTERWVTKLPATYRGGGIDADTGPKCAPLIHEGSVYLFDAAGVLFCLNLNDGKPIWTRDTMKDFRAPEGYFGFGSTPIVIDDKLLVNVGGADAGIVAFDLKDGSTIWQSVDERASYSSPVEFQFNDKRIAVVVTRLKLLGIDPVDGKVLFEFQFGKRGPTVNAAVPVAIGKDILVTASYGIGSKLITTKGTPPRIVWENDSLASQYSTPVLHQGKLFGYNGREDTGDGTYRCIDAGTGKLLWEQPGMPVGHSLLIGDKILMLDCKGKLRIIEANSEHFKQLFEYALFNSNARAIPAISGGRLYARSNYVSGQANLICVEVGQRK